MSDLLNAKLWLSVSLLTFWLSRVLGDKKFVLFWVETSLDVTFFFLKLMLSCIFKAQESLIIDFEGWKCGFGLVHKEFSFAFRSMLVFFFSYCFEVGTFSSPPSLSPFLFSSLPSFLFLFLSSSLFLFSSALFIYLFVVLLLLFTNFQDCFSVILYPDGMFLVLMEVLLVFLSQLRFLV